MSRVLSVPTDPELTSASSARIRFLSFWIELLRRFISSCRSAADDISSSASALWYQTNMANVKTPETFIVHCILHKWPITKPWASFRKILRLLMNFSLITMATIVFSIPLKSLVDLWFFYQLAQRPSLPWISSCACVCEQFILKSYLAIILSHFGWIIHHATWSAEKCPRQMQGFTVFILSSEMYTKFAKMFLVCWNVLRSYLILFVLFCLYPTLLPRRPV